MNAFFLVVGLVIAALTPLGNHAPAPSTGAYAAPAPQPAPTKLNPLDTILPHP